MNYLAVILGLMIAAQPVQAGVCTMEDSGAPAQHADMPHDAGDGASSHGCCEPSDSDDGPGCSDMARCAPCTSATAVVPALVAFAPDAIVQYHERLQADSVAPSHTVPPFRPPKSLS